MASINFKHLRYFWAVARAGSIAKASSQLNVTAQSISSQLSELEASLGTMLFQRVGRGLELTVIGRRVLGIADEIFAMESELLEVVREEGGSNAPPFRIGIADSVPKSLVYQVLQPALDDSTRVICKEGQLVPLLADLAVHRLDMIIADRPMPSELKVRGFSHRLGSSDISVLGTAAVLRSLKGSFPQNLHGMPFLLPGEHVAMRPALDHWFQSMDIRPRVVGEFDDSALLKAFGEGGAGLFVVPSAIASYVCRKYDVRVAGRIEAVQEHLYAISTERHMRHPIAMAVRDAASRQVFGTRPESSPIR